jgi:2-polyprenyl-3-methyl-5-hydroxy-6-metoxy-1,4-benzoquinol methylase
MDRQIRVFSKDYCLICGSKGGKLYRSIPDRLYGTKGEWNIENCPDCGMGWLNPCPINEDIPFLYPDYYTHQSPNSPVEHNQQVQGLFRNRRLLDKLLITLINKQIINPLITPSYWRPLWLRNQEQGNILDLGCGNGQFLATIHKLGWNAYGVEPDPTAAKAAKAVPGIHVHIGELDTADFFDNMFDVIRIHHVLEHVIDPLRILNQCQRILRPNGHLLIQTPNFDSFVHKRFKQYWLSLDPPRHLHLLTKRSLSGLLVNTGYEISLLTSSSRGAFFAWQASSAIRKYGFLTKNWRNSRSQLEQLRIAVLFGIDFLKSLNNNFGEELSAIAMKAR